MFFDRYVEAFNRNNDEWLVRTFWTEDCVMERGPIVHRGWEEMIKFLQWGHDGIRETMEPQVVVENEHYAFAEVAMTFLATKDRMDFWFGPLKKGESLVVKFFLHYTLRDDRVSYLRTATWPVGVGVS